MPAARRRLVSKVDLAALPHTHRRRAAACRPQAWRPPPAQPGAPHFLPARSRLCRCHSDCRPRTAVCSRRMSPVIGAPACYFSAFYSTRKTPGGNCPSLARRGSPPARPPPIRVPIALLLPGPLSLKRPRWIGRHCKKRGLIFPSPRQKRRQKDRLCLYRMEKRDCFSLFFFFFNENPNESVLPIS